MLQTLKCPECNEEILYDPDDGEVELLTESTKFFTRRKEPEQKEVVVYLKCPKGHQKPYKVKKTYYNK